MRNVDPNLVHSLTNTNDGGSDESPYRVEVGGLPGTAENPGYGVPALMTPGSRLATFDEIDAGQATWNPAANSWEVAPISQLEGEDYSTYFNDGSVGPEFPTNDLIDSGNTPVDTTPVDTTPVDTRSEEQHV